MLYHWIRRVWGQDVLMEKVNTISSTRSVMSSSSRCADILIVKMHRHRLQNALTSLSWCLSSLSWERIWKEREKICMWVIWGPNVRLNTVFKSSQLITCPILLEGQTEEFLCSFGLTFCRWKTSALDWLKFTLIFFSFQKQSLDDLWGFQWNIGRRRKFVIWG